MILQNAEWRNPGTNLTEHPNHELMAQIYSDPAKRREPTAYAASFFGGYVHRTHLGLDANQLVDEAVTRALTQTMLIENPMAWLKHTINNIGRDKGRRFKVHESKQHEINRDHDSTIGPDLVEDLIQVYNCQKLIAELNEFIDRQPCNIANLIRAYRDYPGESVPYIAKQANISERTAYRIIERLKGDVDFRRILTAYQEQS